MYRIGEQHGTICGIICGHHYSDTARDGVRRCQEDHMRETRSRGTPNKKYLLIGSTAEIVFGVLLVMTDVYLLTVVKRTLERFI